MKGIYEKLKEKFAESDIEYRIGALNSDKTKGLALAYVSARACWVICNQISSIQLQK